MWEYALRASLSRAAGVILAMAVLHATWMHFVPLQPVVTFPEYTELARQLRAQQFENMSWTTLRHYAPAAIALAVVGAATAALDVAEVRRLRRRAVPLAA